MTVPPQPTLPIRRIVQGDNPREFFDPVEMADLEAGMRAAGRVIQPIIVRPVAGTDLYKIVVGERRWRAAKKVFGDDYDMPVAIEALATPTNQTPQRVVSYRLDEWRKWLAKTLMAQPQRSQCVLIALVLAGRGADLRDAQFRHAFERIAGQSESTAFGLRGGPNRMTSSSRLFRNQASRRRGRRRRHLRRSTIPAAGRWHPPRRMHGERRRAADRGRGRVPL